MHLRKCKQNILYFYYVFLLKSLSFSLIIGILNNPAACHCTALLPSNSFRIFQCICVHIYVHIMNQNKVDSCRPNRLTSWSTVDISHHLLLKHKAIFFVLNSYDQNKAFNASYVLITILEVYNKYFCVMENK